jgi:2-polyprenyl-3-methyl-5-hydroxy-6-metoxy-1,4-benzoquinol methylase
MDDVRREYWRDRAVTRRTYYKNEKFYTTTPVPMYYRRRQILLERLSAMMKALSRNKGLKVLDFACGDGFYSLYLSRAFKNCWFHGCDLVAEFIDEANEQNAKERLNCTFAPAESAVPFNEKFDIILCIAALAHIPQKEHGNIVKQFKQKSPQGAVVILFEQTALVPRQSRTWARRREDYYESLFAAHGFELQEKELIAFPFFTLTNRYVRLPALGQALVARKLGLEKLAQRLRNPNFKPLIFSYDILMVLSRLFDRFLTPQEGNTLFVFKHV